MLSCQLCKDIGLVLFPARSLPTHLLGINLGHHAPHPLYSMYCLLYVSLQQLSYNISCPCVYTQIQMQAHALHWAGAEAVALDYNWSRYTRIVDVGGAYGSFLARLLRRNRRARGVVFDQSQERPWRV